MTMVWTLFLVLGGEMGVTTIPNLPSSDACHIQAGRVMAVRDFPRVLRHYCVETIGK